MKFVEMDPDTTFAQQLATQDDGPIVLVNRFHVTPGDEDEFLALWQEDGSYMLAQGCLSGQLHRGTEGSGSFVTVAVWENAQTLARAFASPEFQRLMSRYPDSCTVSPHVFKKVAVPGVCVA